ncbi:ATP-binding protein [Pseudoxanthomonas wuyuanensis]|uniref:Serine/threonine-protein kinase RsbW n=1 Tax=Pseudoxanthomonas wuyuanensis TaxID=1073196 RepID=A0A286DAJ5_9GAMM|nr:ATP-binding protein [Pseudoxanthomonas wuyuanensis]SOD55664.1 serine/threonine-protein kinase RsbW [Pseudoxanthomonas wuyuanensis]
MLIRLIVPGEYARVEDLNASLEAVLKRHGISRNVRDDVRLIVEELASNAIDYGKEGARLGQHELSVDIGIVEDLLNLEFRDTGAPFDPLSAPEPDLEADIVDRAVGGLGVYLIRHLAHRIAYQRIGDYNVLRVSLRIPTTESEA